MIDKYREYATNCTQTDYWDKTSVKLRYRSATGMRNIVKKAAKKGNEAIVGLLPLLNEPTTANWLAFQILELADVNRFTEARCLSIIKSIAAGEGIEAMGSKTWLDRWEAKRISVRETQNK